MRGILRGLLAGQHETTTAKGAAAETRAAEFLAGEGLSILERNFRVKGGEIDLIARHGATTVFVEVRQRSRSDYGGAAASITPTKQRRIILAARHWLQRHGDCACRFDCVVIDGNQMAWLQDAFSTN